MENKLHAFMVEWTINFVKNKDLVSKKIEKIEKGKEGFDLYVKYKGKEQYFIILPSDLLNSFKGLKDDSYFSIVLLNSAENLSFVLKNWYKFASFKSLSVIFVNPFSSSDKKWILYPHTHNKICDESSLETGLKSMFEMVGPADEQQTISRIG